VAGIEHDGQRQNEDIIQGGTFSGDPQWETVGIENVITAAHGYAEHAAHRFGEGNGEVLQRLQDWRYQPGSDGRSYDQQQSNVKSLRQEGMYPLAICGISSSHSLQSQMWWR
jgi:hypothetical protein